MPDRLIIAGSRSLHPHVAVLSALISPLPTQVICGCATGVDRVGYIWARTNSIPVEFFPAWIPQRDWALSVRLDKEIVHPVPRISNRSAGFIRNEMMAGYAERALIYWNGASSGTKNMRDICLRLNIPIHVEVLNARSAA